MSHEPSGYLQSLDPILLQPQYSVRGGEFTIGRDAEACQVVLAREYVSRRHCQLANNGAPVLLDLGTTNGTFVNGRRIQEHALAEGDQIGLGKADAAHFIFSRTSHQERRRSLLKSRPVYRIGRALENDIPLPNDPTVSARHSSLRAIEGGRLILEDLGSSNGTYVDGKRISRVQIGPDSIVRVGSSEMLFRAIAAGLEILQHDRRNSLRVRAQGLERKHRGQTILKGVSLAVEPGEFVGLLGPSGAGKSTLLKALCGFQPGKPGDVYLNGESLYRGFDMYRDAIGYVPQDDIIHAELSVERSLAYTARLRLPKDNTREQIAQQVTGTIETLGLSHVRRNPVSRLSGGQRKRVSIGCELLTRPSLLFLDEPTSGLDPSTEEKLMKHFGRMTQNGQTVILTTHILYSLDLLDLIAIMARGRLVYFGPVGEVCAHFSTPVRAVTRPIEIFDALEPEAGEGDTREEAAEAFERKYSNSRLFEEYVVGRGCPAPDRRIELGGSAAAPVEHQAAPPTLARRRSPGGALGAIFDGRQFFILMMRIFDIKLAFPARLAVPLAAPVLLALLTSSIDIDGKAFSNAERLPPQAQSLFTLPIPLSVPLMMTMTAVFLGTLIACLEISSERPIYLRERSVNLKIPVYLGAKLPFLFLMSFLQVFVYGVLSFWTLGPFEEGNGIGFLKAIAALTLVAWASCAIGLFISSLDPTAGQNSVVLAVVVVLPQMILCGALAPGFYGGMEGPAKIVSNAAPARWGFEMLLNAFYQRPEWAKDFIACGDDGTMGFRFGAEVFPTNAAALAAIGAAFFAATCVSLKRHDPL